MFPKEQKGLSPVRPGFTVKVTVGLVLLSLEQQRNVCVCVLCRSSLAMFLVSQRI